jgi:hypothetical protein
MAKGIKTKETAQSAEEHINAIEDEQKRADCKVLLKLMKKISGYQPKVWGNGTIGFGTYHYKYPTGQEGDWYITGFAARKANITISIYATQQPALLKKLGKAKTGVGCLYINKLTDVDMKVLEEMIDNSIKFCKKTYNEKAAGKK